MTTRIDASAAAPGIAIGPVWRYPRRPTPEGTAERGRKSATCKAVRVELTEAEAVDAVTAAAHEAADQLTALADRICDAGRADDAGIFDAQAMMATDTAILDEAIRLIRTGMDPVEAVAESATAAAEMLAAVDDELISARAADIRDVGARIGRILRGEQLDLPEQPSVAVADDLPPSVTAEIPTGLLLGVALAGGSRTSHAVILSRGLGIPCVVGATGLLQAIDAATDAVVDGAPTPIAIAVDGQRGEILLEPSDDDIVVFQRRADAVAERTRRAAALRDRPALRGSCCGTAHPPNSRGRLPVQPPQRRWHRLQPRRRWTQRHRQWRRPPLRPHPARHRWPTSAGPRSAAWPPPTTRSRARCRGSRFRRRGSASTWYAGDPPDSHPGRKRPAR